MRETVIGSITHHAFIVHTRHKCRLKPTNQHPTTKTQGIALVAAGAIGFSTIIIFARSITGIPSASIAFFRALISFLFFCALLPWFPQTLKIHSYRRDIGWLIGLGAGGGADGNALRLRGAVHDRRQRRAAQQHIDRLRGLDRAVAVARSTSALYVDQPRAGDCGHRLHRQSGGAEPGVQRIPWHRRGGRFQASPTR